MDYKITLELIDKWTSTADKIKNSFNPMTSAVKKTMGVMGEYKKTLASISKLNSLIKKHKESIAVYREQKDVVAELRAEIEASEKPTKRQIQQLGTAERKLDKLGAQYGVNKANLKKLNTELKASGVDTRKLSKEQDRLRDSYDKASKKISLQKKALKGWNSTVNKAKKLGGKAKTAAKWGAGIGVAGSVAGFSIMKSLSKEAGDFETLMLTLEGVTGSAKKAQDSMLWINDFKSDTLINAQKNFVALRKWGIDPMNGNLQSLTDMNAKYGGDQLKMEGIILAVGQAWAKQKLMGEEILQLVERGVPVWDLLQKATGKNVQELQKLSSKGKLGRKVIQQLMDEMGRDAAGMATKKMATWNGMVEQAIGYWKSFKLMIMNNGAFDYLKDELDGLLFELYDLQQLGKLDEWAKNISKNIVTFGQKVWETGEKIYDGGVKIYNTIDKVAQFVGGWDNLIIGLASFAVIGSVVGTLVAIGRALSIVAGGATLVSGPILITVAAVAALAYGAKKLYDNWDGVTEWFGDQWDNFSDWSLPVLDWSSTLPDFSFKWLEFIPAYSLPTFVWQAVLPDFVFKWLDFIPDFELSKLDWDSILPKLNFSWLEFIPAYSLPTFVWQAVLPDFVFKWLDFIPNFELPTFNWRSILPDFVFNWSDFIPDFTLPSINWNAIKPDTSRWKMPTWLGGDDKKVTHSNKAVALKEELKATLNTPLPAKTDNIPKRKAESIASGTLISKAEVHVRIDSDKPARILSRRSAKGTKLQVDTGRMMVNP